MEAATKKTQESGLAATSPGGEPAFAATPTQQLAAAFSVSDKPTSVSLQFRPFANRDAYATRGVVVSTAYRTDTKALTVGAGFQFRARWLASSAYAEDIKGHCLQTDDIPLLRCIEFRPMSLVPALYLGGEVGFFGLDREKESQNVLSRRALLAKLESRIGPYLELTATGSIGKEAASTDVAKKSATQLAASASVVLIVPVFDWTWYDDEYAKEVFERGIGLGVSASIKRCHADDVANCGSKSPFVARERVLSGILDVRIAPSILPRIVVSRVWLNGEQVDAAMASTPFHKRGWSFELQVATALSP